MLFRLLLIEAAAAVIGIWWRADQTVVDVNVL